VRLIFESNGGEAGSAFQKVRKDARGNPTYRLLEGELEERYK
jgi:hypothetical protein